MLLTKAGHSASASEREAYIRVCLTNALSILGSPDVKCTSNDCEGCHHDRAEGINWIDAALEEVGGASPWLPPYMKSAPPDEQPRALVLAVDGLALSILDALNRGGDSEMMRLLNNALDQSNKALRLVLQPKRVEHKKESQGGQTNRSE